MPVSRVQSSTSQIAQDKLENCFGEILTSQDWQFSIELTEAAVATTVLQDPDELAAVIALVEELQLLSPRPMLRKVVIFSERDSIRNSEPFKRAITESHTALVDSDGFVCIRDQNSADTVQTRIRRNWSTAFLLSTDFHEHLLALLSNWKDCENQTDLRVSIIGVLVDILLGESFDTHVDDASLTMAGLVAVCMLRTAAIRGELLQEQIAPYLKPALNRVSSDHSREVLSRLAKSADETSLRLLAYLGETEDWVTAANTVEHLNLSNEYLDWQQLDFLTVLKSLQSLNLSGTNIGVSDRIPLRRLTHLKTLNLSNTHTTNNSVLQLDGLTSLEELDLSATYVNDASIEALKRLPSLRILVLQASRFRAKPEDLREQLASCDIQLA